MSALNRKLLRDLLQMKGQSLAISLVMASGVATFVMALCTLESLQRNQQTYYDRYRFAHVFAQLKRAPQTLAGRIERIPGVAQAETRVVVDVNLDVPGMAEPAVGRLISIPERGRPKINDIFLRSGRYIEPRAEGEVLVSEAFAVAHGLQPGDTVRAVINGKRDELRIVGVALSPEYVMQIRQGDLLPDPKRFGVFWMGREELAAAYDMEGAFNDVSLRLMRGASLPEVMRRLDDLLAPYGGIGAYDREDQISHRFLSDEIRQLRTMGMLAPSIFLGVSAFLLNIVMSRLVRTQREQIAALKAFGYSNVEVGLHYLEFVLVIAIFGVTLGTLFGTWLGLNVTKLYTEFYKFPIFHFQLDPRVGLTALLIAAGAAVGGTLGAVRRAAKLPPAEAMRPEPPSDYRPTIIERMGVGAFLSQTARMVLRNLERQPVKAMLSCVGIAMACAILVLGAFSEDALDYLIDFTFFQAQRQDMTVTFVEPTTADAQYAVNHLPGVLYSEPFRSVPARLRAGHRSRRLGIMGIESETDLYRLVDQDEQALAVPQDGLLISAKLAEILQVEVGDQLTVEVLEGERPVRRAPVAGIIRDLAGLNAYMSTAALHRMMREGGALSGTFIAVDSIYADELYRELKQTPQVAGVAVKTASVESFQDTIAENMGIMRTFQVMFACVIAFGVVYNAARISLSERSRELATLRVIGFSRAEVSAILLGELGAITVVAIPIGLGIGYLLAAFLVMGLDTEQYRIPLIIHLDTYAFAAMVVILATIFSGLVVRRRIDRLDLIGVLKTRE